MDPVSQGVLGALAAQTVIGPKHGHRIWIAGMAGGLLPDADVVLEGFADPALPWELHRHFTHAYVMAPVIGLLAGVVLLLFPGFRRLGKLTVGAAVLGALTHAPLDLCTSYGTKVYWPFSLENATLDLFPIIDPLLTLALLACVLVAGFRRSRRVSLLACGLLALYVGAALHQRDAALDVQEKLLASRGHTAVRTRVVPLPASLLAWRSLYEVDGRMVADMIRVVPWGEAQVIEGGEMPILRTLPADRVTREAERVRSVFKRFATFADGWTAWDPSRPNVIADMRFSVGPGCDPLWGIRLGAGSNEPAIAWQDPIFADRDASGLLNVILGTNEELRPLSEVTGPEP